MLPQEYDIAGKVVLITGAGRGIGVGIAQVLAEAGADIAVNALTNKYVGETAQKITTATGRRVVPMLADVTKPVEAKRLVETTIKEFGRLDVLVNCLGDAIPKPLVNLNDKTPISDVDLKKVIDVNMFGTILCTRAVGPYFLEKRKGKIINISSTTAARGGGNLVIYMLAKSAVIGFTRAQALEWVSYNIQVNAIAPGLFPDMDNFPVAPERLDVVNKRIPMGRTGKVREVGLLALYLASPASDYMTGQTIFLDGGMSL